MIEGASYGPTIDGFRRVEPVTAGDAGTVLATGERVGVEAGQRADASWHGRVLALWALLGVGVTQPILDLYGSNPEVFIAGRVTSGGIVIFALVVTFGPVAVAALVLLASRRVLGERAGSYVYRLLVVVAAFTAVAAILRQLWPSAELTFVGGLLGAAGVAVLDARFAAVHTWLRFLAVLPVGALLSFLFLSDSSELVWHAEASTDSSVVVRNPVPVVMLVLDELPLSSLLTSDGEINAALFPSFARLGESAHWFQNAQSNSIDTAESVPSILTGTLKEDASPTSRDHPRSLFTMLGESYASDVAETITALCPTEVCEAEAAAADVSAADSVPLRDLFVDAAVVWGHRTQPPFVRAKLPSIDNRWGGFVGESDAPAAPVSSDGLPVPPAERAPWMVKLLAMADNLDADWPSNTLHYTHALAPHAPWMANPAGTIYESPETQESEVAGVENRRWLEEDAWAVQGLQRHLHQLGSVDLLLGRIIQSLERSGLWDRALIIVTADHGASFTPGDYRRWVSSTNADAAYRVPLFIRTPGQPGGRVHAESAYSVDILPTIVDVLDVELGPEWTFSGRSLLESSLPSSRPHHTAYGTRPGRPIDGVFDEIEAIDTLVPDRSSWASVAAVGPHRALIGTATTSLRPRSDRRIVADIDQEAEYRNLDPDAGSVPTVLTGRITLPEALSGRHLLVAVNGRVRGAGFAVSEHDDTSMFQVLVPEDAYHPGSNDVSILVAAESQIWFQARPAEVDQAMLRDANGDDLHLVSGRERRVALDATTIDGEDLRVLGWAANTTTNEPVEEILLYFGDQLVRHEPPNERRPDLVSRFDSRRLLHSGFDFSVPTSEIPDGVDRLTIVGRFSDGDVVVYATIP